MPTYTTYVTEKLRRELEIEAESEQDALDQTEKMYNDSQIVLDYSDLVDTEFSNSTFSKSAIATLDEISWFCTNCVLNDKCVEDECVLYRIEKGVTKNEV